MKRWMIVLAIVGAASTAPLVFAPNRAEARNMCRVCVQYLPGGRCLRWRPCNAVELKSRRLRATPAGKPSLGSVQVQKGKLRRTARNPRYAQPGTLPPAGNKSIFKTPVPHK
jgi:hypothetical protein